MTYNAETSFPEYEKCNHCLRWYELDNFDLENTLKTNSLRKYHKKLCISCRLAKKKGYHSFVCQGCKKEETAPFEQVRFFINIFGRAFCIDCKTGFFGSYNPENPALNALLGSIAEKRKLRGYKVWGSEALAELHNQSRKYYDLVRRLSRSNYKKNLQLLNPKNHTIGPSGKNGSYHLDHIVPVTVCWDHYVEAEDAASIYNLQIIPWFVNLSRGNHFSFGQMIGWPIRRKRK